MKFDSKFESNLHHKLFRSSNAIYHPAHINYEVPSITRKYTADWQIQLKDKTILVEAKGRFRDTAEAKKYIHIRNCLNSAYELVFLFQYPTKTMPRCKVKLDGSRFTMADWAEKNDFQWYADFNFPRKWLK